MQALISPTMSHHSHIYLCMCIVGTRNPDSSNLFLNFCISSSLSYVPCGPQKRGKKCTTSVVVDALNGAVAVVAVVESPSLHIPTIE